MTGAPPLSKERQIRNSLIYLVPVVLGNLIALVTLPLFTRTGALTTEDYGALALATAYAAVVSGLANCGLLVSYDRNFFQYPEKRQAAGLLYTILACVVLALAACAAVTYVFRRPLAQWIIQSDQHGDLLFWTFCATGIGSLKHYFLYNLRNSEKAVANTAYVIIDTVVTVLVSVLLVLYWRLGVIGMVYAQAVGGCLFLGLMGSRFLRALPFRLDLRLLGESLKIGYPLTPRIFLSIFSKQFDRYIIGLLGTIGGVGIYNIGQSMSYLVFTYMTSLENVFYPQVYRRMFDLKEKGGEAIGTYVTPFAYVSILVAVVLGLFAEEAVEILTPGPFHGAADVASVLSMYFGIQFFGKINGMQLIFRKKTHISSLLSFVVIAFNIVLMIPFVRAWGAMGAAWATLLVGVLSGIIIQVIAQHYYRIAWQYGRMAAIFLVFAGPVTAILVMRALDVPYPLLLAFKIVCLGGYVFLGWAIRVVTWENYLSVKHALLRWRTPAPSGATGG